MPVTLRHTLPGCSFALWRIDEDTARLAPLCTGQENAWAGTLAPERRRREWLAWHAALHEEAPAEETFYRPSGAPALRSGRHIAVSHAGGYAALMLCDVPCGLDIERADRDFTKTEERFLAPDERKLLESAGGLSAGIVWCAKEALYKWSGLGRTRLAPRYPRHEDRSGPGNARRNGRRKAHRAESHPASRTAYRLLRRIAPAANRPQSGTPVWRCPFFLLTLSRRNH